jgi:amino acid transporter
MEAEKQQLSQDTEKLKAIPKWTRKYAQNRAIPVLVSLAIFSCIFAGIAIPSYFGGKAYRAGNMVLFWICIIVTAIAMISCLFFSIPKWGGKFIERISQRLYNREGNVLISVPEKIKNMTPEIIKKKQRVGYVVGMIFGSCVVGSVILGNKGFLSIEYMQPVSALYGVPFLVFLYLWQRPIVSCLALLWPTLYAIHAILVVAGLPIQFGKPWIFLNMLIPVAGYGILCGLITHIYSRYALKKLKTAAHLQENTNEQ